MSQTAVRSTCGHFRPESRGHAAANMTVADDTEFYFISHYFAPPTVLGKQGRRTVLLDVLCFALDTHAAVITRRVQSNKKLAIVFAIAGQRITPGHCRTQYGYAQSP